MGIQLLSYHHTQFVAEIVEVWNKKMIIHDELENSYLSVSYTHLTLPTIYSV